MKKINLVKIWSDSIVDKKNKQLKEPVIKNIIEDILYLKEKTWEDFMVLSSWAVAKWRSLVKESSKFLKSTLSSIWQHRLMLLYDRLVWTDNLVSQILIDDKYNENLFSSIADASNLVFDENAKKLLRPC